MEYISLESSKSMNGKSSVAAAKLWKILTAVCLGIAIFALLTSTASLTLVLLKLEGQHSNGLQESPRNLETLRTTEENEKLVSKRINLAFLGLLHINNANK